MFCLFEGNDALHELTKNGVCELRVDLSDWKDQKSHANYNIFSVADRANGYRLTVAGYTGDAGT